MDGVRLPVAGSASAYKEEVEKPLTKNSKQDYLCIGQIKSAQAGEFQALRKPIRAD